MEYIIVPAVIVLLLGLVLPDRLRYDRLKKNGTRVVGYIMSNSEFASNSMYRLGGNINSPVVKFITLGQEITGRPIFGFVSQHEVHGPMQVTVSYDPQKPEKFCIVI